MTPTARNDHQLAENEALAFVMYCDEYRLTLEEGRYLADCIYYELERAADDRVAYLPPELLDGAEHGGQA